MLQKFKKCYFLFFILGLFSNAQEDNLEIYLIPVNYIGKVNIVYNEKCGNPEKFLKGGRLFIIPRNGILFTQAKEEYGPIKQEFYYIDGEGRRKKLRQLTEEEAIEDQEEVGIFHAGRIGIRSTRKEKIFYNEFYVSSFKNLKEFEKPSYERQYEKEFSKFLNLCKKINRY